MGKVQAELHILEGGIAVPNIQAEILTMVAMAVGWWASGLTGAGRTIGDIIMAGRQGVDVYLTPRFDTTAKDANYYGSTMWAPVGAVVRPVHGGTISEAECPLVRDALEVMRGSLSNARWHDGEVV
ncbi:hypothetical protein PsorP6_009833 [Peronosclerospora sorghi]|uniref:Uncharacterized protein n=1 Tax=Peronosclerospora sorghi TaxID=230839 RepID=A0ACC0VYU3_9STRA|nr:hypothetical protein PsorP6_009833 [Peronosclerospora sorghi]